MRPTLEISATRAAVILGVATGAAFVPHPARACSLHSCVRPYVSASGTFPANARGFVWAVDVPHGEAAPNDLGGLVVRVVDTETGTTVGPLSLRGDVFADDSLRNHWVVVEWPEPLSEGHTYRVEAETACEEEPWPAGYPEPGELEIGPPAPLPTELGALVVTERGRRTMTVGAAASCSVDVDVAFVDVEVQLTPNSELWRDALIFETLVDGEPYTPAAILGGTHVPGASWVGRGRDAIVRRCAGSGLAAIKPLTEGPHRVRMRATLAGEPTLALETPEIIIDLTCESADAGTAIDASPAPDAASTPPQETEPGGCACSTPGHSNGPPIALLPVLLLLRRRCRARLQKGATHPKQNS